MNKENNFEEVINAIIRQRLAEITNQEQFTFFWETRSPFSQWHKVQFTSGALDLNGNGLSEEFSKELNFSSAEQFMMLHKALLFDDYESAKQISQTRNVRDQKVLGRGITGFDDTKWKQVRAQVVYYGNKQKFLQNDHIREELLQTKGTTLVEAAPDDCIWGIGLVKDDPLAGNRETWKGTNLLGEILTYIRMEMAGEY